jgi:hypothetical protein
VLAGLVRQYQETLQSDRRHLLAQFQLIGLARKVVGAPTSASSTRRAGAKPVPTSDAGKLVLLPQIRTQVDARPDVTMSV